MVSVADGWFSSLFPRTNSDGFPTSFPYLFPLFCPCIIPCDPSIVLCPFSLNHLIFIDFLQIVQPIETPINQQFHAWIKGDYDHPWRLWDTPVEGNPVAVHAGNPVERFWAMAVTRHSNFNQTIIAIYKNS